MSSGLGQRPRAGFRALKRANAPLRISGMQQSKEDDGQTGPFPAQQLHSHLFCELESRAFDNFLRRRRLYEYEPRSPANLVAHLASNSDRCLHWE